MSDKTLIIPSTLESINIVEKIIDEISENLNISSELYGKIIVAVVEAVNNAISHGNKLDESKNVYINFSVNDKMLVISVEDQGCGFDPNTIPDPTAPENIENISGRGVFIMQQYTDKLDFNSKGTKVTLTFNI